MTLIHSIVQLQLFSREPGSRYTVRENCYLSRRIAGAETAHECPLAPDATRTAPASASIAARTPSASASAADAIVRSRECFSADAEMPEVAAAPARSLLLPLVTYRLFLKPAFVERAAAALVVQLWGALGDCGRRALWTPVELLPPHALHEYSLRSVWLGRLERATVGLMRLVGTAPPEQAVRWPAQRVVLLDDFENIAYNLECDGCVALLCFALFSSNL